jgi:hypothetical protein
MESRSRGVLDTPHARGMTTVFAERTVRTMQGHLRHSGAMRIEPGISRFRVRANAPRNDGEEFLNQPSPVAQIPQGLIDGGRDPRRVSTIRSPPLQAELP